jgi:hypothetical protein
MQTSRGRAWKNLVWGRGVIAVALLVLFLSTASWFWDELFPDQARPHLVTIIHWVDWRYWILAGLVAILIMVVEGAFRMVSKTEQELEAIEKAKPRIKLKEPGAIYIESVSQNYGNKIFNSVPFLKVRFMNDPGGPYPSAKANDVRATINYFRLADSAHILSIDGRWAESDQPSAISPLASKSHLLPTTFGIGEAHSLDIAYRDVQTGKYFAWNNDNYRYPFFRYDHHLLEGDRFRVEIRLLGDWVDERFSFSFKATDDGFVLESAGN